MVEKKLRLIKGDEAKRYVDFLEILREFDKLFTYDQGDDRNIVIMGGTFLELALEHVLRGFFPEDNPEVEKLFEVNGALSTFSNRISMAFSLGLVDKTVKDDLHIIRKIRNEFAHNLLVSFEDDRVASLCKALKWHKKAMFREPPEDATIRDLFQVGVHQVISHLHGCILIARDEKRKILNS